MKLQQCGRKRVETNGLVSLNIRGAGEITEMPLLIAKKKMQLLRGFGASGRDESRTENDERDEIFPTDPNSVKTEFFKKILNFPIRHC